MLTTFLVCPPGAAMGPRMVQADRRMEAAVRRRVSRWLVLPLGGQLGQGGEGEEERRASTVLTGEGLER